MDKSYNKSYTDSLPVPTSEPIKEKQEKFNYDIPIKDDLDSPVLLNKSKNCENNNTLSHDLSQRDSNVVDFTKNIYLSREMVSLDNIP